MSIMLNIHLNTNQDKNNITMKSLKAHLIKHSLETMSDEELEWVQPYYRTHTMQVTGCTEVNLLTLTTKPNTVYKFTFDIIQITNKCATICTFDRSVCSMSDGKLQEMYQSTTRKTQNYISACSGDLHNAWTIGKFPCDDTYVNFGVGYNKIFINAKPCDNHSKSDWKIMYKVISHSIQD